MAGGIKAKRNGQFYEKLFDSTLEEYEAKGRAIGYATYPEIKIFKDNRVVVVGQAMPDRIVTLKGGQACWIEIKSFKRKNQMRYNLTYSAKSGRTNTTRFNQYMKLSQQIDFGAKAAYVVAFHDEKGWIEWRLFSPKDENGLINDKELPVVGWNYLLPAIIHFSREKGRLIPSDSGYPDWLAVI